MPIHVKILKLCFYIAQYPVLRTAQSVFTLYFPGRPVHSNTISTFLGSIQPHLMCESCSYTYPPLFIARHSFIQLSELEQCGVKSICVKVIQLKLNKPNCNNQLNCCNKTSVNTHLCVSPAYCYKLGHGKNHYCIVILQTKYKQSDFFSVTEKTKGFMSKNIQ